MARSTPIVLAVSALALLSCCVSVHAQGFTCDGQVRLSPTPVAPFPTQASFFFPIATPAGLQCQRKDQPATVTETAVLENRFCGGRQDFTCTLDGVTFGPIGPITHGTGGPGNGTVSGAPEAVVPPSDPIIYSLTDPDVYLTYVEYTVVDVGSGGARLGGVYGSDPNASPNVVNTYAWVPNGDQGGSLRCAACSNCERGKGIVDLNITAEAGAGFRAVQLSANYEDVRCGGSCRDSDGIYWSGFKYTCAKPTCADANLDLPGLQPFDCTPYGKQPKPGSGSATNPSEDVCCQAGGKNLTCSDSNPDVPNQPYSCPANYTAKPGSEMAPASLDNCCVPSQPTFTCLKSNAAGDQYSCPPDYLYKPASDNLTASQDNCCQQLTCAKADAAGNPFSCPAGYQFTNGSDNLPASVDNCCTMTQAFTCAKADAAGNKYSCPPGYLYKPISDNLPASQDNCCEQLTCATSNAAGDKYSCPDGYKYKNGSDSLPASVDNCCAKAFTCSNSNDQGEPFQCPSGYIYNSDANDQPAGIDNCCVCKPHHFGKFGKFFGKGGSWCIKPQPPTPPPTPPPHPTPPTPPSGCSGKGLCIRLGGKGGFMFKPPTFQMLPFPFPFFGRRR